VGLLPTVPGQKGTWAKKNKAYNVEAYLAWLLCSIPKRKGVNLGI